MLWPRKRAKSRSALGPCRKAWCLLVGRAEGNGNGLLVQHVLALAVGREGTGTTRSIKEAWVDLAVAGQTGEDPGPLLKGVGQDLHHLNAWHVPPCLYCLRNLHPINPAQQAMRL